MADRLRTPTETTGSSRAPGGAPQERRSKRRPRSTQRVRVSCVVDRTCRCQRDRHSPSHDGIVGDQKDRINGLIPRGDVVTPRTIPRNPRSRARIPCPSRRRGTAPPSRLAQGNGPNLVRSSALFQRLLLSRHHGEPSKLELLKEPTGHTRSRAPGILRGLPSPTGGTRSPASTIINGRWSRTAQACRQSGPDHKPANRVQGAPSLLERGTRGCGWRR